MTTTYVTVQGGLNIMQCGPTPAATLTWYQEWPWIFIFIALAAAAVLLVIAW